MFGGYASRSWASVGGYVVDDKAYLFSMSLGMKLKNKDDTGKYALVDYSIYGPSFGFDDVRLKEDCNTADQKSIRNSYLGPSGETTRAWAPYLAGGNYYKVLEIEVYGVSYT